MGHKIYIVEDHPIFFEGLKAILDRESDIDLCGHARHAAEAKDQIPELELDTVILDLALPDGSGFDLIHFIKTVRPKLRMLVLSALDQSIYARRAIRSGAHGFLSKREAGKRAVEAIRTVLAGELYLSPELKQRLIKVQAGQAESSDRPLTALSDRELDVYRFIGTGLSVREIAARLNLSPKTVETYRANIKRKLGVTSARALIRDATIWCFDGQREDERAKNAA